MKKFFLLPLIFTFFIGQTQNPLLSEDYSKQNRWVDSIYNNLDLEEKIGQLITVWVATQYGEDEIKHISKLIEDYKLGGLIFSLGDIKSQAKAINKFQKQSKVPLLISMDAEWGIGMRLDDAFSFPYNMTLGAIENDSLIYQVGKRIGFHAKRLGVQINFAPVVDINTNPANPIIGFRSFGEDKYNVSNKALNYLKGMHHHGIMGAAKHFPGHGDTETDSHLTLPTIGFSKDRIDEVELYPFKKLIENGLDGIMTAHLNIPSLKKLIALTDLIGKINIMTKKNIDDFLEKKVEDGKTVSPILPDNVKNYLIDIDGTICDDIPNEEPERMATAKLYPDALETLNKWYDQGHIICFFTSRTEDHREVTQEWLDKNGFKYHSLVMGKPRGGNYHWIDNHLVKATRYNGKFTDLVDKNVTIQVFKD